MSSKKYRCFSAQIECTNHTALTLHLTPLDKRGIEFSLRLDISGEGEILQYDCLPEMPLRTLLNLNFYMISSCCLINNSFEVRAEFEKLLTFYFGSYVYAQHAELDSLSWLLMLLDPRLQRLSEYKSDPLTFKLLCCYSAIRLPDDFIWKMKRPTLLCFLYHYLCKSFIGKKKANHLLASGLSKAKYRLLQKLVGFDIKSVERLIEATLFILQLDAKKRLTKSLRHEPFIRYQDIKYIKTGLSMNYVNSMDLCFRELVKLGRAQLGINYISDIKDMQTQLNRYRDIRQIKTVDALILHHDALVEQLQVIQEQREAIDRPRNAGDFDWEKMKFPKSPLKTNDAIKQLCSFAELKKEGRIMKNCIGANVSYARKAFERNYFYYSVFYPERATLALVRSSFGNLSISELKAKNNQKVRAATVMFVQRWLESPRE